MPRQQDRAGCLTCTELEANLTAFNFEISDLVSYAAYAIILKQKVREHLWKERLKNLNQKAK